MAPSLASGHLLFCHYKASTRILYRQGMVGEPRKRFSTRVCMCVCVCASLFYTRTPPRTLYLALSFLSQYATFHKYTNALTVVEFREECAIELIIQSDIYHLSVVNC